MKLIIGVSKDGWIARSPEDDMSWLGPTDKAVFKMLTLTDGGHLGVSAKTAKAMPKTLEGRQLVQLSRDGITLEKFRKVYPEGWLIGGQEIAMAALESLMVDEAFICRSSRSAFPVVDDSPVPDLISMLIKTDTAWELEATVAIGDVTVECWRWH